MSRGPLSPDTRRRLLQGQAGPLPAPLSRSVAIYLSSVVSDMDAEREALQCSAYPEVQSFCRKHGLTFEVVDLRCGVGAQQAADPATLELCLEELQRCMQNSAGATFVALLGDQYGPCLVPLRIEEKEWEALSAQLASRSGDLQLLNRHFRRDENTLPPTYVLQPSGSREACGPEEATLTSVLHCGAQEAWRLGLISQGQWLRYHWSVLEWEMDRGLLSLASGEQGATVFLREIPDLHKHLLDDCALKMVDRLADGCLDADAQNQLHSLKGRVAEAQPGLLKVHRLSWSRDLVNPKNKAHARYLRELSEQFVTRTLHQLATHLRQLDAAARPLDWLYQDICHHLGQSAQATGTFCGRQELLAQLGDRLKRDHGRPHPPLVLFGPPGIGKTALLCQLARQAPELLGCKTVTVLRLLGTSQLSMDARGLLRGVCFQLCLAFGLPPPPAQVLAAHSRVVYLFHALLHTVSRSNFESLVLLLDSVDDLDMAGHARRVPWLPLRCPPRVHLVLSARSGQPGVLDTLRGTLRDPSAYWEVKPLSARHGQDMVQLLLAKARRTLSGSQSDALWAGLPDCGHPGRLMLAFHEAATWASFTTPVSLATSTEGAMHDFCTRLERKHGQLLVAHVLGYLASSRRGLTEAELKDVLSLDDDVLKVVYQDWTPPSTELLRFPPLLWVRIRRDLGHCLVHRSVDGCSLLALAHRQLADVVRERYLSGPERARSHGVLADFFSGAWSLGTKKLITLPLLGKPLNLDRKVAPQPLWFSDSVPNLRKLSELPYHLLYAERTEELKQEVLGSMSWIACRGSSGGVDALLDDFDLCVPHMDCPEVGMIREALQLCQPALELHGPERSVLAAELLARLLYFATTRQALVGRLCQEAQSWLRACPHPVLLPLVGFLQPPGGPLQATLTGCHKGVTAMAWSTEEKLLVVGTQDGSVAVWNVEDQQVVHVMAGHSGEVRCVRVFARGTLAVSASTDRMLRVWDLLSGQDKVSFSHGGTQGSPEPHIRDVLVDEAHRLLYCISGSKINAWQVESAELLFQVPGDAQDPWACVALWLSPARLLTVSKAGSVGLWCSATGNPLGKRPLCSVQNELPTCAVSTQKHACLLAGFSQGSVVLISSDGDRLLEKLPEAVVFLVVSEDESFLAAGFGRWVRIFLQDSECFHRLEVADLEHEAAVETALWGPENNLIVTASQDALVQVWSLSEQGALLHVLEGVGAPGALLARGGPMVACASWKSSSIRIWDPSRTPGLPCPVPFPDRLGMAAVSHNGRYVYFPKVGNKNKVVVWDTAEGAEQDALDTSNEVRCLEVAERAKLLFTGLVSGVVLVFPLLSRQDVLCIPPPQARKAVQCLALSGGEDRLAIAYDNIVLVLDICPGDPCPVLEGPTYTFYTQLPETITRVAVLADARVLYGMSDGGLFLYECARARVSALEAHGSAVTCVGVSHGEGLAVSGARDSQLCLWELHTGQWRLELRHTGSPCCEVRCASFSRDDKLVFAGLEDRSVIVWSVLDGTLLAVQCVHAALTRIIPTSSGFLAPTSHGYIMRMCFQHLAPRGSRDPLKNFRRAAWRVRTRPPEELAAPQEPGADKARGPESKADKLSRVCLLL